MCSLATSNIQYITRHRKPTSGLCKGPLEKKLMKLQDTSYIRNETAVMDNFIISEALDIQYEVKPYI